MANYETLADEVVLYKDNVTSDTHKQSVTLTLTSQKIVLEKEKGFFKKELELIDLILLSDVKIYNEKPQVKQSKSTVEIQTISKNLALSFYNTLEASKFTQHMLDTLTGTTIAQRGANKVKSAFDLVDDTLGFDTRSALKGVLENGVKGTILNGITKKK